MSLKQNIQQDQGQNQEHYQQDMSINSSSSSNHSPLFQNLTPNISSSIDIYLHCVTSEPGSFIFITFSITNIILHLPLCIFILHHGLHRCCRSSSSAAAVLSHSDCFTYHMVIMELIGVSGSIISGCGIYANSSNYLIGGVFIYALTWHGEIFFHTLTCIERYLAVIHPVTYLKLKNERWIRIRNISTSCVWLVCIIGMILVYVGSHSFTDLLFLVLSSAAISFCSVSVLWALMRPGPGEQVGGRERSDQSKQRAFYTIMAILGAHVFKFGWNFFSAVKYAAKDYSGVTCALLISDVWFNLPASLVLPLLFLIRVGKLECCKHKM